MGYRTSGFCCGGCQIALIDFSESGNWASRATVESGTSTQLTDALRLAPGARLRIKAIDAGKVPFMVVPTFRAQAAVSVLEYRWEIEDSAGDGTPEETVIVTDGTGKRVAELDSRGVSYFRSAGDPETFVNEVLLTVAESNYYAGDWSVGVLTSGLYSGSTIITSDRSNPQPSVSLLLQNDSATGLEIESLWITRADTPDALHAPDCSYYGGPTPVEDDCPYYPYACAVTAESDHAQWLAADIKLPGVTSTLPLGVGSPSYCENYFEGTNSTTEMLSLETWSTQSGTEPTFTEPQYTVDLTSEVEAHATDCTLLQVNVTLIITNIGAWRVYGSNPSGNRFTTANARLDRRQRYKWTGVIARPDRFAAWPKLELTGDEFDTVEEWVPGFPSDWGTPQVPNAAQFENILASINHGISGVRTGIQEVFWYPGFDWDDAFPLFSAQGELIDGTALDASSGATSELVVTLNP